MRVRLAAILCVLLILTGCSRGDGAIDDVISLRNKLLRSNGCSFRTTVNADYGDRVYVFTMDCEADKEGNLTFTVTEPATIAGINGKINGTGGAITFDDQVLAFQTIADGQVTPVTAPWLLIKTLRGGYLKDCAAVNGGLAISIDDSYKEESFHLSIVTKEDQPTSAEIFWQGRRVLTLSVENFTFL